MRYAKRHWNVAMVRHDEMVDELSLQASRIARRGMHLALALKYASPMKPPYVQA